MKPFTKQFKYAPVGSIRLLIRPWPDQFFTRSGPDWEHWQKYKHWHHWGRIVVVLHMFLFVFFGLVLKSTVKQFHAILAIPLSARLTSMQSWKLGTQGLGTQGLGTHGLGSGLAFFGLGTVWVWVESVFQLGFSAWVWVETRFFSVWLGWVGYRRVGYGLGMGRFFLVNVTSHQSQIPDFHLN